ncbi:heparinase II/III domain-containing protein [Pontibacter liquoris]|uniref:heparinase II/III domain-containing protein n=1 Tax=Pontibacter liquoris TaxID=2905677 RepID=UPI001FA80B5D
MAYRLRKIKPLGAYQPDGGIPEVQPLTFSDFLPPLSCADAHGTFDFLNKPVCFKKEVDWDYMQHGKLWNYNLHYAHYVLQEEIPLAKRLEWLYSLHAKLKSDATGLEPYPVSVRAMNIIRLLCRHKLEDQQVLQALFAELRFLSGRVEYHLLANHVLENAFALFMGGAYFKQTAWLELGQKLLKQELQEQVLGDGAQYELSPMYHQIILYRMLELIDWYQHYDERDEPFLAELRAKAALMLGWLQNITFRDNHIPYLNDSAPGITYTTGELLGYAEALRLTPAAVALFDSGYRMFRQGKYECVVDVAEIGPSYQAGHGHADALAFILHYKDRPVLVEAGTSTYEAGAIRNYERSTQAHNTVVVNQTNQSDVWGGFRVGQRAHVALLKDEANILSAEHDGYLNNFKVKHNRTYTFGASEIMLVDQLLGRNVTEAVAYFHLHPDVTCEIENDAVRLEAVGTMRFVNSLRIEKSIYNMAAGFNKCIPATVIKVFFEDKLETRIEFL